MIRSTSQGHPFAAVIGIVSGAVLQRMQLLSDSIYDLPRNSIIAGWPAQGTDSFRLQVVLP